MSLPGTPPRRGRLAGHPLEFAIEVGFRGKAYGKAGTAQQRAAEGLGAHFAIEVFADRTYDETGFLMDRRLPGAVLHDPDQIANRVVAMVEAGAIQTVKGEWLPTRINTICLHGDTAGAGEIARRVKTALKGAGMVLRKLDRVDCR